MSRTGRARTPRPASPAAARPWPSRPARASGRCRRFGVRSRRRREPISAMKRPMPTEIAYLSLARAPPGTPLPEAGEHQEQDDHALDHDKTHRVGPGHVAGDRVRHEGVEAESGGERERVVRDHAHQDRQHAGDQGGGRRDRREWVDARAVAEVAPSMSGEAQDDRVEHDDVGHREEGDDAASHLARDRRTSFGDLEACVHDKRSSRCPVTLRLPEEFMPPRRTRYGEYLQPRGVRAEPRRYGGRPVPR